MRAAEAVDLAGLLERRVLGVDLVALADNVAHNVLGFWAKRRNDPGEGEGSDPGRG